MVSLNKAQSFRQPDATCNTLRCMQNAPPAERCPENDERMMGPGSSHLVRQSVPAQEDAYDV